MARVWWVAVPGRRIRTALLVPGRLRLAALLVVQPGRDLGGVALVVELEEAVKDLPLCGGTDEVVDQLAGLCVRLGLVREPPALRAAQQRDLGLVVADRGGLRLQRHGPVDGVVLGLGQRLVVVDGDVVEEGVHPLRYVITRCRTGPSAASLEGLQVHADRVRERGGAGEQALLEQERHEVGRLAPAQLLRPRAPQRGELGEQPVDLPLALRVLDRDRARLPLDEPRRAVGVDDVAFEPAHHGLAHSVAVRLDAAGEALVVEDLQQRGERRLVAVVWRRRQEQPMREVRGEPADQLGLLRVDGVHLPRRGGRDVVGLVEDEQVEDASVGHRARRQHLVEQPLGLRAAQPRQADDRQREDVERVCRAAEVTAYLGAPRGVDHGEVQAELLGHLVAPLRGEPGRTDDHDPAGAVAQ